MKLSFLLLGTFWVLCSCSTVPEFTPSRVIEQVDSLSSALRFCSSYQIPENTDPKKASVLVPWIQCLELSLRKFPESSSNEGIFLFLRALNTKYEEVSRIAKITIHPANLNQAVGVVFRWLLKPSSILNVKERKLVEQEFPQYAIFLAENGSFSESPPALTEKKFSPEPHLFETTPEFDILKQESVASSLKIKRSPEMNEFCKNYRHFKNQYQNLKELEVYKESLDQKINPGLSSDSETQMLQRVKNRFFEMKSELVSQDKNLCLNLKNIQTNQPLFYPKTCLVEVFGKSSQKSLRSEQ